MTLVFVLNPPNFHPFYSARWLSGAVVEIIKNSTSGETEPTSALGDLQNAESLAVRFDNAPPRLGPGEPPWPLNRVLATVRNELGDADAPSIEAVGMGPSGEPVPVVPADAFATLPSGPLRSGEDLLLPPVFPDRRGSPRRPLADDWAEPQGRAQTADPVPRFHIRRHASLSPPLRFLQRAALSLLSLSWRRRPTRSGARPKLLKRRAPRSASLRRFITRLKPCRSASSVSWTNAPICSLQSRTIFARRSRGLGFKPSSLADGELREGMLANIDAMRDMLAETLSFAEGDASSDASAPFDLASILISLCDEASDAGAQSRVRRAKPRDGLRQANGDPADVLESDRQCGALRRRGARVAERECERLDRRHS